MKTTACIVLFILLFATFATPGDETRTALVLELELRGDLADEEADVGSALTGLIETVISGRHGIASHCGLNRALGDSGRTAKELYGDPEGASAVGASLGAHLVVMGRLTPIGADLLLEVRVADVAGGKWAGLRVKQCSEIEEVPATLEALLVEMGFTGRSEGETGARKLAELEAENAALRTELEAVREELNTLQDLFKPYRLGQGKRETPAIKGVVTGVNNDLNIVVLSVGRDDHVKPGFEFTVYRDNEYVATLVVDKVEKDYCSGYSRLEVERMKIEVGDQATTRF